MTECEQHPGEEKWVPVPGASGYEVSNRGGFRSLDRLSADGRRLKGKVMKPVITPTCPYPTVKYTLDSGARTNPQTIHRIVLEAFTEACPPGMETCHRDGVPAHNCLENLRWGTKEENEADKPEHPVPAFDCLDRCGNKVIKKDRRCDNCRELAGRKIARMLRAGMNLEVAAVRFGYQSDWAYKIAVEFGGYEGSKREARLQQPRLSQRVRITLCDRRRDGWGDDGGDAA